MLRIVLEDLDFQFQPPTKILGDLRHFSKLSLCNILVAIISLLRSYEVLFLHLIINLLSSRSMSQYNIKQNYKYLLYT